MKKAIFTREIQNGIEMILKGHDNNGKEIWIPSECVDRVKAKSYSKYKKKSNN